MLTMLYIIFGIITLEIWYLAVSDITGAIVKRKIAKMA